MADVEVRVLVPEALTAEAWAPFGVLPADEAATGDPAHLEFLWDDGRVNFIGHTWDEASHAPDGTLLCDHLNRHDTHTQTLMPMDGPAVIVVAPAALAMDAPGDLDAVRAFLMAPSDCVHLARGTWHWGPFPVGPGSVRLFNVQGAGYAHDNTVADLAAGGTAFAVPVAAPDPAV